jgi:hypothetical protein
VSKLIVAMIKSAFHNRTAGVVKDTQSSHPLNEEADDKIIPQQRKNKLKSVD